MGRLAKLLVGWGTHWFPCDWLPPIMAPVSSILPIHTYDNIYSLHEFEFARPQPAGRARRALARGQCQPRCNADRAVAARRKPCTAAPAGSRQGSAAGARGHADGIDAAGLVPARAIGAGARAGARA